MGVPIPRIHAWSAEPLNSVGAEYIIEEKAVGSPLGWHWHDIPMKSRVDIVNQIVGVERGLCLFTFQCMAVFIIGLISRECRNATHRLIKYC